MSLTDSTILKPLSVVKFVVKELEIHGYPQTVFLGSLPGKAVCVVCECVPDQPMSTECGHRYCKVCSRIMFFIQELSTTDMNEILQAVREMPAAFEPLEKTVSVCAESNCQETLNFDDIHPDPALQKQLARFNCKCDNAGCDFQGPFNNYTEHIANCGFAIKRCSYCKKEFLQKDLESHLAQCDHRPELQTACKYCSIKFWSATIHEHEQECPEAPTLCRFCASKMLRKQLSEHERNCKLEEGRCAFGCDVEKGTLANEHYKRDEVVHHQRLQRLSALVMTGDTSAMMTEVAQLNPNQVSLAYGAVLETRRRATMEEGTSESSFSTLSPFALVSHVGQQSIEGVRERMEALEMQASQLRQDAESAHSAILENERLAKQNHTQMQELTNSVAKFTEKLQGDWNSIHLLNRRALHANDMTLDGSFVWRLDNVPKLVEAAKNSPNGSTHRWIDSSSFYTSSNGYKLRLRLYLNGANSVFGQYMSLYAVICRGEFDAINRFPFRRNVEFTCFDQRISQQNDRGPDVMPMFKHQVLLVKAEDLPTDSMALRRPITEYNSAFGVERFLPLSDGRLFTPGSNDPAFVRDGVMFLRMLVEPFDAP